MDKLNQIAAINKEMRDMLDKAEAEKRTLTDEEKEQFNAKEQEVTELRAELEAEQKTEEVVEPTEEDKEEKREITENKENKQNIHMDKRNFYNEIAVAVRAIANGENTAEYANVAGNSVSLRASGTTLYTDNGQANAANIQAEELTELVEPLQAALIVDKLGIKVVNTKKAIAIPSVNNVEASIEGEVTQLVGQKLEFKKSKVEPFRVGLSLPFSMQAIKSADIDLIAYAIRLAGKCEAQIINKIMFAKQAVNGKKGAFVDVLANSATTTVATSAITYLDVVNLAAGVAQKNVPFDGTEAYVMSPSTAAVLKTTPKMAGKQAGAAGFIIDVDGKIDGHPVLMSSDVDGYIGFGVFSNYLIQRVGEPWIVVDNLSRSKEAITEINFNDLVALQTVRAEGFSALKLS